MLATNSRLDKETGDKNNNKKYSKLTGIYIFILL